MPDRERILVAMSGGVDSSVAAARLLDDGFDVVGAFMRNGVKAAGSTSRRQGCCGVEDALDARRVADRLGIPFYALDYEDAFEGLIGDFVQAYLEGRTPNPCIECNRRFKMGSLALLAGRLGASGLATGHYARVRRRGSRWCVARARDHEKDQSYVLFSLDQDALALTRLPLGRATKAEVREEARSRRLPVAEKPESMEICFVPTGDYRDVVRERAEAGLRPGPIVDAEGRALGEHGGTALFTVGQRRGLPGGQGRPLYVTALEPATATVRVGPRAALEARTLVARDATFSGAAPGPPGTSLRGRAKIRSHHEGVGATVTLLGEGRFRADLDEPVLAISPGQAVVVYDGDDVLLGGWITRDPTGAADA